MIGSVVLERSQAAFQAVCVNAAHDTLFCLHRNGLVSARRRTDPASTTYKFVAQSEPLRLASKSARVVSFTMNPKSQSSMALVTSDGRVLFYEVSPLFC